MGHHADSLVSIPVDDVELEGMLEIPADASRVVVFAHGSGSSRQSPRNNFVADIIRDQGLGTLLFDSSPARRTSTSSRERDAASRETANSKKSPMWRPTGSPRT